MGRLQRPAPHADRAARQRARAVRGRRAQPEFSACGAGAAARATPDESASAARPRTRDRRSCLCSHPLWLRSSLWPAARGIGSRNRGDHATGPGAVLPDELPA